MTTLVPSGNRACRLMCIRSTRSRSIRIATRLGVASIFLVSLLVPTPTFGQQEARRATVVTIAGDTVEGSLRGFENGAVLVEVAGQTIRVPVQEVRYISFVGRLETPAAPAPTPAGSQPATPSRELPIAAQPRPVRPNLTPPRIEQRSREWKQIKSPDLLIIGNTSDGDLRKVAVHLDRFRQSLGAFLPASSSPASKPVVVVLFKDDNSFRPYLPIENGQRKSVGGYFIDADAAAYLAAAQPGTQAGSRRLISHEYAHFVVSQRMPHLPTWLSEGLAEFFSSFRSDGPDGMNVIGEPDPERLRTLRGGSLLPIQVLMKGDLDPFDRSVNTNMFYAQSWALVHSLIFGQSERLTQLNRYIGLIERGATPEGAFETAFGGDYERLDRELRDYLRRFSFPVRSFAPTVGSSVAADTPEPMGEIEALQIQTDLLLAMGSRDDAAVRLKHIQDLDPDNIRALTSTGRLWVERGQYARALAPLKKAIAASSPTYFGHYWLGRALQGVGEDDQALAELGTAASLKLDDPRLLVTLSVAFLKAGRSEEAEQAFGRAEQLSPSRDWHEMRAYRLLALDKGTLAAEEAEAFLKKRGWQSDASAYMAIAAAVGYRQALRPQEARRVIDEALPQINAKSWQATLLRFLGGAMSVNDLLAQSDTVDKKTEAYTYAGLIEMYDGRTESARKLLTWVVENGNSQFNEHPLASTVASRRSWVGGQ